MYGFAQNSKTLEAYTEAVNKEELPILKGFVLSKEDLIVREHILNIMCHFETRWKDNNLKFSALEKCLDRLKEMENDGLLIIDPKNEKLRLLEHARPYVRNVCIAFDLHLIQKKTANQGVFYDHIINRFLGFTTPLSLRIKFLQILQISFFLIFTTLTGNEQPQ